MSRYILRFCGHGVKPEADVQRITATPRLKVLDHTARMLLVEGAEGELRTVLHSLSNWVMTEETFIPAPDSRPKLQGKNAEPAQ